MTRLKLIFLLLSLVIVANLDAQTEKNLLPKAIILEKGRITFTYDEQNRFTTIKKEFSGNDEYNELDSIFYMPDDKGYIVTKYKMSDGDIVNKMEHPFTWTKEKKGSSAILTGSNGMAGGEKMVEFDMHPSSGKVVKIELIGHSNNVLAHKLDEHGNITGIDVNDANLAVEFYKFRNGYTIHYDNKNGIFRNVDLTPLTIVYNAMDFPYYYFLSNNVYDITQSPMSDPEALPKGYVYNKEGYPISSLGETAAEFVPRILRVSYVEGK